MSLNQHLWHPEGVEWLLVLQALNHVKSRSVESFHYGGPEAVLFDNRGENETLFLLCVPN